MASGNFSSASYSGFSLYVEWSSTSNVSANTSSVNAKVYVKSYGLRASALSDSYIIINGNKKNWTYTFNISNTSTLQTTFVTEYTVTVPHNADGTKSITIKANMEFNGTYGGTSISDLTASKDVTLDTIPRSSSFSIPSSINTGSSLSIAITPSSSSFKHKVSFEIDGDTKSTSSFIAAGTTSYSYTIPHSWLPSSTSKTMKVYLYTYTGNGDYLAYTSKNTTVNVPSSIKPTVSSVTSTIVDGLSGKYVQGKSKVTLTATASAGSGSSISSYIFRGYNIYGSSSSYTGTSNTHTSSAIQTSGTVQYEVAAKDARGRISDYQSVSINVFAYAAPQVTSISAQRCLQDGTVSNDGTYAKVTVKTSYSPVDGANTRTVKLYNSKDNFVDATIVLNTTDTDTTYTGVYGNTFDISTDYIIKATIQDAYSTHSLSADLKVSERTINIAQNGKGVAFGGFSSVAGQDDEGLLECYWDAKYKENLIAENNIIAKKSIIMSGLQGQTGEQDIVFSNPTDSTNPTHCTLYGGNPNSATDIGIWDYLKNGAVIQYVGSADNNNGVFFIQMNTCIKEAVYNSNSDNDETALNNWLNAKLNCMPNGSIMPCKICCYPAISGTSYSGFLFKHAGGYAHLYGKDYFGETIYKPLQNGTWLNTEKYSYGSIDSRLTSLENRHANEFSSISTNDLPNTPSNWSGYGRVLRWGVPSSTDKYYLLVCSNGKLFTGVQLNGASQITWYEK